MRRYCLHQLSLPCHTHSGPSALPIHIRVSRQSERITKQVNDDNKACGRSGIAYRAGAFSSFEFSDALLRQVRKGRAEALATTSIPDVSAGSIEQRTITAEDGHDIGVMIHSHFQSSVVRPAILHIHGGGYINGSPKMMTAVNQRMACDVDCVVVSVDYRLA